MLRKKKKHKWKLDESFQVLRNTEVNASVKKVWNGPPCCCRYATDHDDTSQLNQKSNRLTLASCAILVLSETKHNFMAIDVGIALQKAWHSATYQCKTQQSSVTAQLPGEPQGKTCVFVTNAKNRRRPWNHCSWLRVCRLPIIIKHQSVPFHVKEVDFSVTAKIHPSWVIVKSWCFVFAVQSTRPVNSLDKHLGSKRYDLHLVVKLWYGPEKPSTTSIVATQAKR